jgi:outer membrane protein TolC
MSRARLSSAAGSSQEVLALAGAKGVAEDETADIRQQQSAAGVAFQRWVGVPPDVLQPPPALALPSEEAYVAAHPTVATLQRELDMARRNADVTAANRKPNWSWDLSYGQRTGYADMVSVAVNIPLAIAPGERQDRDTAAQRALADKAEAALAEATRGATAGQRTAAATAAYQSSQGSLLTLFEARHAEVEAQRKLLALQRELARTQVQLAFKPLGEEVAR